MKLAGHYKGRDALVAGVLVLGLGLTACSPVPLVLTVTPAATRGMTNTPEAIKASPTAPATATARPMETEPPTVTATPLPVLLLTLDIASQAFDVALDMSVIGVGAGDRIRIYELDTGQLVDELVAPPAGLIGMTAVAFSPMGSLVAASPIDENVVVWDWSSGQLVRTLTADCLVTSLAFSADGRSLAAGCGSETPGLLIWETQAWAVSTLYTPVIDVAFSPVAPILAGALDVSHKGGPGVVLWDTQAVTISELFLEPDHDFGFFTRSGGNLAFSASGERLAAIVNDELHVWDLERDQESTWTPYRYEAPPRDVAWSSNNTLAVLDQQGLITLVNADSGIKVGELETNSAEALLFAADGRLIVGGFSRDILMAGGSPDPIRVWRLPDTR